MESTKKTFSIVADVAFNIPRPMLSSFNSHHKTRLIRLGGSFGKVTTEGATFFSNRTRVDYDEMLKALSTEGYAMEGVWAYKNNIPYKSGSGINGRTLFSWALSSLTQAAVKVEAAAKAKAIRATNTKAARVRNKTAIVEVVS